MNACRLKLLVFSTCLFFASWVYASCPVQQSVIFYVNGVNNTWKQADDSRQRLEDEVFQRNEINKECVTTQLAYNVSAGFAFDLLESVIQKVNELNITMPVYWDMFLMIAPMEPWLIAIIEDSYLTIDAVNFVEEIQLNMQVNNYRELGTGKKLILVGHSQGNFYTNEAWKNKFSSQEQQMARLVAVATPSFEVADGGNIWTTLTQDEIVKKYFVAALEPNITNDESYSSDWESHGFQESYLTGLKSKKKIIDDIISLLPKSDSGDGGDWHEVPP